MQNMKAKRRIGKQVLNEISESDSDKEDSRKSKFPNTGNNKNTRQSTIPGYVKEVRQNLMKQQERDKTLLINEAKNMRKEIRTQNREGMKKGKEKEEEKEKEKEKEIENEESSENYSYEEEIESREEEDDIIYNDEKEEEKNSLLVQIREISNQEIPATLDKLEESGVTIDINSLYTNANRVMSWRVTNQKSWNNWNTIKGKWAEPEEVIGEIAFIWSTFLYKCSLWSYFDRKLLEDPTMKEWNEFCERENISHLKDRVTIRYFDNKPPIGLRFIVETPSEKDVFKLVNNHQGAKIGKIPVRFGPYFDRYKPPISVVGFNLPPTWDADRIIKLANRVEAEILMVTIPPSSIGVTHYCKR